MKKSIILARPESSEKQDLELLLNLHFKERFNIRDTSSVHIHQYMELLILCSDDLRPEELPALRNNHTFPVIMLSDKPKENLISEYNIYRSTSSINPDIIPLIKESIRSRELILQSVGNRPEIFFNLDTAIEQELKSAKESKRIISSFEALCNILQRSPAEILKSARRDPQEIILEQLRTRVLPFLEQYERIELPHYIAEAQENFRQVLHVLKEVEIAYRTTGDKYKDIEFLVGGSTLSEQGIRCLVGINYRKKYDVSTGPHGYFLRDVHDRKGMNHFQIAKIRYDTQKHLAKLFGSREDIGASEIGKFTKMYYPLSYESVTYLIQEALIGPDLEYVLLKIRDAIPNESPSKANLLRNIRNALIEKYLDDLIGWQKHTQKVIDEDAKKMGRKPEIVARYYKNNLKQIPEQYKSENLAEFSESELCLWDSCLKYLNPKLLGISRNSVVLSQDASSKNAILHIGRKFPSMDELLEAVTEKSRSRKKKPSRKKIDDIFHHVDTGFVPTHFLEDFFHIIDAYEASDAGLKKRQILKNKRKWYEHFCKKKGIPQSPIVLNLAGAYRNMRRAFLVVKEFHNKNVAFARDNLISEYAYTNFRRSYEQMNTHHMERAVIYLDELKNQFQLLAKKTNMNDKKIRSRYREITSRTSIDAESAVEADEFINNLQSRIQGETSRKDRKYLGILLNGTMSYCMARLAERMVSVKLPNYETARRGVSDE